VTAPLAIATSEDRQVRRCRINGCDRKHAGLGLCHMHWLRKRKTGSTDPAPTMSDPRQRLLSRVRFEGDCWICVVRSCIRPSHLEAVTQAENNRREAERLREVAA
jgi:hypothetical protein